MTDERNESILDAAPGAHDVPPDRRILILDTSIKVLYPSILVLGAYFLFAGHNRPGGGFVGGLVIGAGLALRYVSGGATAVRNTFRLPPHLIIGIGLLMSALTAFIPVLLGGSILEHGDISFDLPIFHHVKITSALPFDLGVDFVVVGLVLMAFAAFGEDVPEAPGSEDDGSDRPPPVVGVRR